MPNGSNPASDDTCTDQLFWAAHDANYNVIARCFRHLLFKVLPIVKTKKRLE